MILLSNTTYFDGIQIKCQQLRCDGNMFCNGSSLENYKWAVGYKCESCFSIKYQCDRCNNDTDAFIKKRVNMFHKNRLCRHQRLCHTKNTTINHALQPNKRVRVDNSNTTVKDMHVITSSVQCDNYGVPNSEPINCYDTSTSYEYFKRNAHSDNRNKGAAYIIGLAISGTTNGYTHMHDDDVILHLLLSRFVSNLTRNQRVELGFILELIKNKYERERSSENHDRSDNSTGSSGTETISTKIPFTRSDNSTVSSRTETILTRIPFTMSDNSTVSSGIETISTRIPFTESEFARIYLRGPNSILQNIPQPRVTIIEGHSYVSVKQCLCNFLSMGHYPGKITYDKSKVIRNISDSHSANQVLIRAAKANPSVPKEDILVVLGMQWSDDFEPNGSSKSNRGSVWMKTLTFVSDTKTKNDIINTYPLSIGLKGASHDCVEEKFIMECKELASGRNNIIYCARRRRNVFVHFEVIASLGDQPERRSMNYMMLGNSTHSSRYGYAANIGAIAMYLPPCEKCFTGMKEKRNFIKDDIKCQNCVNWNLMSTSPLLNYDAPKDYPNEMIYNNKLRPMEVTFKLLKFAVNVATTKLLAGDWSEKNVLAYCGAHGINVAGCQELIKRTKNINALNHFSSENVNDSEKKDASYVLNDYKMNKMKYTEWRGGPFWNSNLDLIQFVDALMHLMFLGVTKSTKSLLNTWICKTKRAKKFKLVINQLFTPISEMGLDWCKLLDKKSGWVSDNYLAFARVIKWFYHPLTMLQPDSNDIEPTTPVKKWNKHICAEWLKNHDCDNNGQVNELRNMIIHLKSNNGMVPKVVDDNNCCLGDINHCIGSLLSMVAIVMTKEVDTKTTPYEMDREIKIFLTNIDNIDSRMINNKSKKSMKRAYYWIRKYNYQSLLNLPRAMQIRGPLVNCWEGANQGEGYLRFAKPMIRDIHSINWQLNAHLNLLRGNAFDSVVNNHIIDNCTKPVHNRYIEYINMRENRRKKMYFSYSTVTVLYSIFKRNRPISCIRTTNNCYYAIVKPPSSKIIKGYPIFLSYSTTIKSLEMNFHTVKMNVVLTDADLAEIEEMKITKYILLLPKLGDLGYANNEQASLYYVIDSEWNELNENMHFSRPTSPGCKY